MAKLLLPILLATILLASGCLDNITIEDRLACMELTSYSFTLIPECYKQEDCFSEVEGAFPFNEEVFSSKVQEHLFDAKNHLAKAWLFTNKAKTNLKVINNQCSVSRNLSLVPKQVNELNSNLLVIGNEIDEFNREAVQAIYFEIQDLELEDVNSIKEEFLFDDYILLNQNVIDFSQKNLYNDTYASRFLFQAEKFNTIATVLNLQGYIQETTLFGIIAENDKAILSEAKKNDFPISFISPFFTEFSAFLRDFFALTDSVQVLKALPSFELFSAINSLIGSKNSSSSAFFELFMDNSTHRISLKEKNIQEKIALNTTLELSTKELELILENYGDVFVPELFQGDSEISGIENASFSLENLQSFSESYLEKIDLINKKISILEEADFLGTISLGEKTSELKNISKETENLLEEIIYVKELLSGVDERCEEKLLIIKEEIQKPEFESDNPIIISLKSRINAELSSYQSTQNTSTCVKIIQNYSTLNTYLDSTQLEQYISLEIDDCFKISESLLNQDSNSLKIQLDSLKRIPKPYPNPELILSACLDIKERLQSTILEPEIVVLAPIIPDQNSFVMPIFDNNSSDQNKLETLSNNLKELENFIANLGEKPVPIDPKVLEETNAKISALKKSLGENVQLLESNFVSLSKEELNEVYAFSPITLEKLEGLKKVLEKNPKENELSSFLVDLENADETAFSALEKLKENSLSSYNVAVSKRNSSEPNSELDSLLLNSKTSLEEKSYLKSLLNSQKASSLTGLTTLENDFEIPLPIYPLVLVLLGVAFYVHRKSEEEKKPKPVIRIKRANT